MSGSELSQFIPFAIPVLVRATAILLTLILLPYAFYVATGVLAKMHGAVSRRTEFDDFRDYQAFRRMRSKAR